METLGRVTQLNRPGTKTDHKVYGLRSKENCNKRKKCHLQNPMLFCIR